MSTANLEEMKTLDANEAVAQVAHRINEVIAIYPITPSTSMGELSDQWSAEGKTNLWGAVPLVAEMQAEGGAAGAVHGALQSGSLVTTFTASQGLLLMIPNMLKIAGELTAFTMHVAARSLAAQALSIYGDHSDVMAVRNTGFALLASGGVQEAQDFALIAQAASLKTRVPFLHFFDGFRTSHEINKIMPLGDDVMRALMDDDAIQAHRDRGLNPDRPVMRGTAQNPDVYFQARETVNPFYDACPGVVQAAMDQFAALTGRQYKLFDYVGAPDAERVVVLMGSGAETAAETVKHLVAQGEKVGAVIVRLYRPWDASLMVAALPATVKAVAVLDRTKEPGASGEPLYLDVVTALAESDRPMPKVIGGRYGLSSKEFTPGMVKAVLDELSKPKPKNHFTIGIIDDVTHTSIDYDADFRILPGNVVQAVFFGLGSDGTVGANKNSIKIIGEDTPNHAQGFFYYDSKKSGSMTVSHLRFGPEPIRAPYLIRDASFVACHQFSFMERYDVLGMARPGATFLLNSPFSVDEVWDALPKTVQETMIAKRVKFYVIDAVKVAEETGMGRRINTVMQVCFFALSNVLPREEAIDAIKTAIEKTYGKRGEEVVQRNFAAVDASLENMHEVKVPAAVSSALAMAEAVPAHAPAFVQAVTAEIIRGRGDLLPVSQMPIDGTYPTGTTQYEKRNIAAEIPVWDMDVCIQCGKCVFACPHAVIRQKVYDPALLKDAPPTFKATSARFKEYPDMMYTLQVAPEDCTGCALCVEVCPAKNKSAAKLKAINMTDQIPLREPERANWEYFLNLPELDRTTVPMNTVKHSQLLLPLFEFSGACAGCGETPYLKLLTQLFGDRLVVANATGCSSIYGGNLPTTPWAKNADGRGPAWSNSLFEDNAEFGFGMRLAWDQREEEARVLLDKLSAQIGDAQLVRDVLTADQHDEAGLQAQRARVDVLKSKLAGIGSADAKRMLSLTDAMVKKSVWVVGGDGWAYDIGYGGLDHVLASGRNVNVLVMDTEVYSNTGGQMSKATPRGAVAKFAAAGKPMAKKDLAMLSVSYGNIYVARVAMGASDAQTIKAILEAEAYDGPSIVIAYTHCIAHGYDLRYGFEQQKAAVRSGHWPLFRYDPRLVGTDHNPFQLDSKAPDMPLRDYIYREGRYRMLQQSDPDAAARLLKEAEGDVKTRWQLYMDTAARFAPKVETNGSH